MFGEEVTRPVVLQPPDEGNDWGSERLTNFEVGGAQARARFREFFRNFRLENVFIYRDALIRQWNRREMFVEVDLSHLNQFDEVLFSNLQVRNDISIHTTYENVTRIIGSWNHCIRRNRTKS